MDKFPRTLAFALEFLLYALLAAFALHATWLTWPDAFIDFSRELYLPWRVSCGDVLYRDLAYDFGPLSVYTNAALFALLGRPSIHALFSFNFAFWLAALLALRAILRRIASPAVAMVCISSFVLLFSFNRYTDVGNYNFLAPYSHELPRGLLLSLFSLLSLDSALERPSWKCAGLAGFLLGLALFAKPEIALAAVASSSVLVCSRFFLSPRPSFVSRPPLLSRHLPLLLYGGGVLAAAAAVLLPLAFALGSFSQAIHDGLLRLYLDCFNPALSSIPFYKKVVGTDMLVPHALRLLLGAVLAFVPLLLDAFALPRLPSRALRLAATVGLVLAAFSIGFFAFMPLNAALPLAPAFFAAVTLWKHGKPARAGNSGTPPPPKTRTQGSGNRLPLALAFAVFALALIAKILLNAHIWHYGFVLALPAFCCAVMSFLQPPCPLSRAVVAMAILLGFSSEALRCQSRAFARRDVSRPIHLGAYIASSVQADAFNAVLDWLRDNTASGSTLAVLPEGALLNVLSGRSNPTPYIYLGEGDILRFGESTVLAAYSNTPPDTLVLVQTAPPRFGIDYATDLMAFLDPRYTPAFTLAAPSGPVPCLLVATRLPAH